MIKVRSLSSEVWQRRASGLSGRPTGSETRSHAVILDRHFGHLNFPCPAFYHDTGLACLGLTVPELS
jgi:hypothetical protein